MVRITQHCHATLAPLLRDLAYLAAGKSKQTFSREAQGVWVRLEANIQMIASIP